jgi:hypothetical protein
MVATARFSFAGVQDIKFYVTEGIYLSRFLVVQFLFFSFSFLRNSSHIRHNFMLAFLVVEFLSGVFKFMG